MKRILLFLLTAHCSLLTLFSQAPQGFNYQAVARDDAGNIVPDQVVGIRISILQGNVSGTVVYSEIHAPTTNSFGLVTLEIGSGTTSDDFTAIDWGNDTYFMKLEMDASGGTSYSEMGTSQLLSVPYALNAEVEDELDPIKGTKGGFAIGGFSPATKGITNEYLRVSPDSVRVYIDEEGVKGTKGGFAVGGFSPVKGTMQDIMRVTIDSTRIFVDDSKAGFGIASVETGVEGSFLDLTTENYFIGHESGQNLSTGLYNSILGYKSGYSLTGGDGNCFMGYESGYSNTTGEKNMFFGYQAGYHNTDGIYNQFFGYKAGFSNTSGGHNVFIGYQSGYQNTTAWTNTFIGGFSGYDNTTGTQNVFLGASSGANNTTGYNNVYVGYSAGNQDVTGHGNVFLGYEAGRNEGGSNKLYIDNTSTSSPLIYGDFGSNYLRFNGNVGISVTPSYTLDVNGTLNIRRNGVPALYINGDEAIWCNGTYFSWGYGATYNAFVDKVSIGTTNTSGYMLYVYGSAYTTGSWAGSDARFKEDVQEIEKPLEKVLKMKGVNYRWKTEEYNDRNFPEGRHYGVIAQEIETVLPEIVMETNGEKAVAYTEIIPVLIEAMKEQQNRIEVQQSEINELKKMVEELAGKK